MIEGLSSSTHLPILGREQKVVRLPVHNRYHAPMNATDNYRNLLILILLLLGTVVGLAGTDLVLPAAPSLPAELGGTAAQAQSVFSSYVIGLGIGLLVIGELGARWDQRIILVASLLSFAVLSYLASTAQSLNALSTFRVFQGFSAAAPAVFSPGIIKRLYSDKAAVRAMGLIASIQSIVPAFAPLAGAWLLTLSSWRFLFEITAAIAFGVAILAALFMGPLIQKAQPASWRVYWRICNNPEFLQLAGSQALTFGALLTFVFGVPVVFTASFGVSINYFVALQICGVSCFILAANLSHLLVNRFGAIRIVLWGTACAATAAASLAIYGLSGGSNAAVVIALFAPMNLGLGLRGPTGFMLALNACEEEHSRGTAIILLASFGTVGLGTLIAAPFLSLGLFPLAATSVIFAVAGLILIYRATTNSMSKS